jgi:ribosomal protein S17E
MIFRIKDKFDKRERVERKDCYLDVCTIYNSKIISLKDRLMLVNFNDSELIKYPNIFELMKADNIVKSAIRSALIKKIYFKLFQKYPNYLVYLKQEEEDKLKFSAYLFPPEEFIKIFSFDFDKNQEKYEKLISEGVGLRYVGTKQHAPTLSHYIFVQLNKQNEQVEQGGVIELYSNFAAVLSILNKEPNERFDFLSLIPDNIEKITKQEEEMVNVLLGDNILGDHLIIHEFLNKG